MASQFVPVLVVLGFGIVLAAGLLGMAALMGQRSRSTSPLKHQTFESGLPLLDRAQKRIPVRFYLVALVFVVLDVEVAFLYPWAVTYREFLQQHAFAVFLDMLVFIVLLAFVYVFLWKKGVFDWNRRSIPTATTNEER